MPTNETTTVDVPFGPASEVPVPGVASTEQILQQGRGLALSSVPFQVSGLLNAVQELRSRSTGSTAAILPSIVGQLDTLRKQYAMVSRQLAQRLGQAGGGFQKRLQSRQLSQAATRVGGLLTDQQQQAYAGLLNLLGNVRPSLGAQARAPVVATRAGEPIDPRIVGAIATDTASVLERIFNESGTNT